jgi:hypothetical protein
MGMAESLRPPRRREVGTGLVVAQPRCYCLVASVVELGRWLGLGENP